MSDSKITGALRPLEAGPLDEMITALVEGTIQAVDAGGDLSEILQALLNAYMNLSVLYGLDVDHTQRVFRALADQLPEFTRAVRLDNAEIKGSA